MASPQPYANPNLFPVAASTFEGGTTTWTNNANTTVSVSTADPQLGDTSLPASTHAMRVTATAAGSASTTSPRVPVTAGTTYIVRLPTRPNTANASKSATVTATWYNALTGGTPLTTTTATFAVANTSSWSLSNIASIVGTAPAGAVSATLTCSISGMAAAEFYNIDDAYFGVASLPANSVFDYNTQSMEVSSAGWSATNGTLSRISVSLEDGDGYAGLQLTSSAAGDVPLGTAAFFPVTAGVEYASYAAFYSNSASVTTYHEIRWYNAGGTLLSTEQRTWSTAQGDSDDLVVVGTAPAGATQCKVYLRPQATASGQIFYITSVTMAVAPNKPGNLLSYDEYSFESSVPAWTASDGGTFGQAFLSGGLLNGDYTMLYTPTAPGRASLTMNRHMPVTAGQYYGVGALVVAHNPDPGATISTTARTRVDWLDASGALVQADNPDGYYTYTGTQEYDAVFNGYEVRMAPPGAVLAEISVDIDSTNSGADAFLLDSVYLAPATPDYTLAVDSANGVVDFNVLYEASNPAGDPQLTTLTIQRVNPDGSYSYVRGYGEEYNLAPYTLGPVFVQDYEAPLGGLISYAVTWSYAGGVVPDGWLPFRLYTKTVAAPVLPDPNYVWFKSPGLPAVNTQVMMEAPISWQRSARAQSYQIVGRKNPVNRTDVRGGRTASITLLVWDEVSNDHFDGLLDSGLPALVQAMPGYGVTGNLYVSIGDVQCDPVMSAANLPGWRWTLALTEIDRPAGGIQGSATRTWQDIADENASWQTVFDTNTTWADVLTGG